MAKKRVNLNVLPTSASSKQEECEYIDALCNRMSNVLDPERRNTYLGSLFSLGLYKWVSAHIQDDLCCDVMAELDDWRNKYYTALSSLSGVGDEVTRLTNQIDAEREKFACEMEMEQDKVAGMEERYRDIYERWSDDRGNLEDGQVIIAQREARIAELAGEVIRLKADLYDKMVDH